MLASTQDRDNYSWDAESNAVTQPITAPQILEMGPSEPERCLTRDLYSFYSWKNSVVLHTPMTFSLSFLTQTIVGVYKFSTCTIDFKYKKFKCNIVLKLIFNCIKII